MIVLAAVNFVVAGVFGYTAQQIDEDKGKYVALALATLCIANSIMFALNA